ncbi:class I SAM-dependent methyltransferase [Rhodopirellula halodulae]|uniref:class I SAM-dependent methyltransferase n=1 Tax=Rhodopirellula halodulae TaxID=2894198 RepID=UPI001E4BC6FD|nr:class I SAM-dependent methyltransferase [Rhodopirellula sp. JC737]MCC9654552.1 class I SAM-dependent methyltransferase [Rhodopirellula sp. JC737]
MVSKQDFLDAAFGDSQAVANYAELPRLAFPGFVDMQRMTTLLLAERVAHDGQVLVIGAGGGLELKVFADAQPSWTFDGVDPSPAMLQLAKQTLGPLVSRVSLHEGKVDVAPDGPFDAATCILTMHFADLEERRRMLSSIRERLKPNAPFVVVHLSFAQSGGARSVWLSRYAAYVTSSGVDPAKAAGAREAIDSHLTILDPEQDESLLREAGFSDVSLFYAGFAFRGWVSYA